MGDDTLEASMTKARARRESQLLNRPNACAACGGPHRFDTTVPSVVWNEVIRAGGLPEYLCTTCIIEAFVKIDQSFTATLWGEDFHGSSIEVQVNQRPATDAARIQAENDRLRARLRVLEEEHREATDDYFVAKDILQQVMDAMELPRGVGLTADQIVARAQELAGRDAKT